MNSTLNISLVISLALHCFVICSTSKLDKSRSLINNRSERVREIEIFPQKIEKIIKTKGFSPVKNPPQYAEKNTLKKLIIEDKNNFFDKSSQLEKNTKEIILSQSLQDKNVESNPAYIGYYKTIREKIRDNAFRYYNQKETGEIFLSFVIADNGQLRETYLKKESSDIESLRNIAVRSVRAASPFPGFPKELKEYLQLQFNISIQFKSN